MSDETEVEDVSEVEPAEPEAPRTILQPSEPDTPSGASGSDIAETKPYAVLGADGRVSQVSMTNAPMAGWVELSPTDYDRLWMNPGHFKLVDGAFVEDAPAPQPVPTVVPKLELYRRMTDAEYEQMAVGVASQSKRIQDIFARVDNFREDDSLWPLLVSMGHQLFGQERTAELLKPL